MSLLYRYDIRRFFDFVIYALTVNLKKMIAYL